MGPVIRVRPGSTDKFWDFTDATVAQAVIALRSLVQSLPGRDSASSLVLSLTRRLSFIHGEDARASVFWLGSRYGIGGDDTGSRHSGFDGIAIWAPDLLREGVRYFMSEVSPVWGLGCSSTRR